MTRRRFLAVCRGRPSAEGGTLCRKWSLGLVPVEAQFDHLRRLSQEDDGLLVGHRRDGDVVDGDDFVAGSDAAVVKGGIAHEGTHVVSEHGFVLLAQGEPERALLLGEDDFEFLEGRKKR